MTEVRQTETDSRWFDTLRDRQARSRIDIRIRRLSMGNPGDVKPVGKGVAEFRVCFVQRGDKLVILLAGGDPNTQDQDIQSSFKFGSRIIGDCDEQKSLTAPEHHPWVASHPHP